MSERGMSWRLETEYVMSVVHGDASQVGCDLGERRRRRREGDTEVKENKMQKTWWFMQASVGILVQAMGKKGGRGSDEEGFHPGQEHIRSPKSLTWLQEKEKSNLELHE